MSCLTSPGHCHEVSYDRCVPIMRCLTGFVNENISLAQDVTLSQELLTKKVCTQRFILSPIDLHHPISLPPSNQLYMYIHLQHHAHTQGTRRHPRKSSFATTKQPKIDQSQPIPLSCPGSKCGIFQKSHQPEHTKERQ